MSLDDIPEIPPYPRKHSIVLHPFLEVFRSVHDHDHDTPDKIQNFGTIPPANPIPDREPQPLSHAVDLFLIQDAYRSSFPDCRPIPARHEVALSSFSDVSTPIRDMDAGSQLMSIPVGPQDPATRTSTTGTTSDPREGINYGESGLEVTVPMHSSADHAIVDRAENIFEHIPLITGGTFVTTGEGSVFQTHTRQKGIDKLLEMTALGASHNSAERYEPPRCHSETRKAVLKGIMDWVQRLQDSERRCFFMWLYGPAGAGKSAVAQSIAELCDELKLLAASFFFSRTAVGRGDHSRLIATLAYQLCLSIPEIRTYVEDAVELDPNVFSLSLEVQLRKLILDPLVHFQDNLSRYGRIHPILIIIDGLDECASANYVQSYVLRAFAEKLPIPMFFLVASRPEPHIREFFTAEPMASITTTLTLYDSYQTDVDIRAFLQAKFDTIKRDHPLMHELPKSWPSSVDIDYLVRKSSGQFIYPSTVMKYVESPHHWPTNRLEVILGTKDRGRDTPFAALDALYTCIFSSVEDINTVLEVISVLLLVKARTTFKTLALIEDLLGLEHGDLKIALIDLHSILDIPTRADLVEIRILHAPLADFLLDQARSRDYHINQGHAHANLTQYFMKHIPQKIEDNDDISVLCGLSSAIFTVHCSQSYPTPELLDALWRFDISAFWTLYFSRDWNRFNSELRFTSTSRAALLSNFFTWLKHNGSSRDGQDLYSHYISTWDRYMRHSLTQLLRGPLERQYIVFFILNEIRDNYSVYDVFYPATVSDVGEELFSNISSTLKLHDGHRGYDLLLRGFFGDPSRSGLFYLDGDKYANFATTFTKYLISPNPVVPNTAIPLANWRNWKKDLPCLSIILSKASYSKELVTLLDSKLLKVVEAQDLDSAQTAADIVTAYCSNPQSSFDNRYTAPHVEDSGAVIGAEANPFANASDEEPEFFQWDSFSLY